MRGTLINTASVLGGGLLGLAVGKGLPSEYQSLSQSAIGIGTVAMGLKMFLDSKNVLIPIGAMILGGLLGHWIGLQTAMEALGEWAKRQLGSDSGTFQEAFVTTSILYCVGPMTLLGCLEDGLEGKVRLLGLKSLLDGISSFFFSATLGVGALLSAGTVFIVQTPLTLSARAMRGLAEKPHILSEITSSGGLILVAIGLRLLEVKKLPTADFLPALLFAGIAGSVFLKHVPKHKCSK